MMTPGGDLLFGGPWKDDRSTAIVGVAKNCGKTTALNHLIDCADRRGETLGLVSIGIDGEACDFLLGTPKPPVNVPSGQWVVSTREALERSGTALNAIVPMGYTTPLGQAVLAQTDGPARIVLAGLRHSGDLTEAIARLVKLGAARILVDGAYGRLTAAQPHLCDAVIVSTGAIVGDRLTDVVQATAHLIDRLMTPLCQTQWVRALSERSKELGRPLMGADGSDPIVISERSAILGIDPGSQGFVAKHHAIAIPGLISDRVVDHLLALSSEGTLIASNPTMIRCEPRRLKRLMRGWNITVCDRSRVRGITVNPTSIAGAGYEPKRLVEAISLRWPKIPVFDPVSGVVSPMNA
jgi:hypothetical protein